MKGKAETIKDYHERINQVLLFINNNLEEKLTLETLSSISNFSPFHFHRIMRAHLGESIGGDKFQRPRQGQRKSQDRRGIREQPGERPCRGQGFEQIYSLAIRYAIRAAERESSAIQEPR